MTGRVLVVDDHALLALALQLALSGPSWEVEATSGPTAADIVDHANRFKPHCVLLDLHLGGVLGSGLELVEPLVSTGAHVVMMTAERRRMVLAECIEAGADGWIGKDVALDQVGSTLTRVLAGEAIIGRTDRAALLDQLRLERAGELHAQIAFEQLTHCEALVLGGLVDGLSADEIAHAHVVSLATVRSQIRAVLQKLGVRSQLAAVALASPLRELLPHEPSARRDRRRGYARGRRGGVGPDCRR